MSRDPGDGGPESFALMLARAAAALSLLSLASCGGGSGSATDAGPAVDAPAADAAPSAPDARPASDAPPAPDAAPGTSCNAPIPLLAGEDHAGDTTDLKGHYRASCSPGSSAAVEAIYRIDLGPDPVDLVTRVTVDEEADPPFDAVLYARTECANAASEVACADFGYGDRLEVLGQSGELTFIVDGTYQFGGTTKGAYLLETSVRTIAAEEQPCDPSGIASRCESGLRCSGGTCVPDSAELACSEALDLTTPDLDDGSAEVSGRTFPYAADHFQGSCDYDPNTPHTEDVYRIDLSSVSDLEASTDFPETDFDTYLYLRSAECGGAEIACHDDVDLESINLKSHLTAPALEPGTYYLFVDGSGSPGTGSYRLEVTVN